MKKLILYILLLMNLVSFGQSTDLDRERFSVSYVSLPDKPILDNDKRTYSINIRSLSIKGFSKVKSPGNLDIDYQFLGTKTSDVTIDKKKHEKKDKDGKVISVSYTYVARAKYSSEASIKIVNSITNNSSEKYFSESTGYVSKTFNSRRVAEKHYEYNKEELKTDHRVKHKRTIKKEISSFLNREYGYIPKNVSSEFVWILDSKKHPEFKKHHEAYNTMKSIFAKMKYDEPTDKIKEELQPVIAYFEGVIPRYPGTKRRTRKLKYASYYNLANIYYYLDMPDKVKEYGQKIIDNDYDKSDGRRYLEYAESLKHTLSVNKTDSRHMKVLTEDISNVGEVNENIETLETQNNVQLNLNKAYLITKKNDTILVEIRKKDIENIAYNISTTAYDNDGVLIGTKKMKAKNCKELLFVDGLYYKNIKFNSSSEKSKFKSKKVGQITLGRTPDKLCKVLFESEKIGLYKFKNKELVVVTPEIKNGESTQGKEFVFGFNRILATLSIYCPNVSQRAKNKGYKNTEESLLKFCKDYSSCE